MRTFIVSNRPYAGAVGGSTGVNYRTLIANHEYKFIGEAYSIFSDKIVKHANEIPQVIYAKPTKIKGGICKKLVKIDRLALLNVAKHKKMLANYEKRIQDLNKKIQFTDGDYYIFHDVESAYCFCRIIGCKKTLLVYHQQGSLYSEWESFTGRKSHLYKYYLAKFMNITFSNIMCIGFPSFGAKDMLLNTEPYLKVALKADKVKVFYNGIDLNSSYIESDDENIIRFREYEGIKFSTVSTLNDAKAVDRIPQFLADVKRHGIDFMWLLVGNGTKSSEVEKEISKFGIEDNTIWLKSSIPHDHILQIFRYSDFYIMFHRYSIFDYATLEAMREGNIPILSNVGGNKEVIVNQNGFLVEDFTSGSVIVNILNSGLLEELKTLNTELVQEKFSSYAFLKAYLDWENGINVSKSK